MDCADVRTAVATKTEMRKIRGFIKIHPYTEKVPGTTRRDSVESSPALSAHTELYPDTGFLLFMLSSISGPPDSARSHPQPVLPRDLCRSLLDSPNAGLVGLAGLSQTLRPLRCYAQQQNPEQATRRRSARCEAVQP